MSRHYSAAFVGNPNCGKTTLFNAITGSNQHIGNWSGVTVEMKTGTLLGSEGTDEVEIVDLPGIYSLNASSEDELVARDFLLSDNAHLIVNIVDASNLERNLFLTLTLLGMKKPMMIVLNMMDVASRRGITIDADKLSGELGVPVIGINALNGIDARNTRRAIREALKAPHIPEATVHYPDSIEETIREWSGRLGDTARFKTLMLLEDESPVNAAKISGNTITAREIREASDRIEAVCGDSADIAIAGAKYDYITRLAERCSRKNKSGAAFSEKIDTFVLNRWLGVPIFLVVIYILFWVVTQIGGSFIDFFDILFGAILVDGFGALLSRIGSPDWLTVILASGVGGGLQTVATFIPIIFTMFFMLSLLEDSGYMARASYVMDKFMRMIGLPGKAFVPMLVGFGCTVPAVMATRTLENKKDRYLTVFMAPFMSCGARLPVYALFGAAFFGKSAGLVVVSLYLVGILMAVVTGFLLKNTLFKGEASHFAMELPPYHPPRLVPIMKRTWFRLKDFVLRAGKVIVFAVLILSFFNSMGTDGSFGHEDGSSSLLSAASRAITPVFAPMGIDQDNWPATVGLISGVFAKEAIVGTMNSLYGQIAAEEPAAETPEPVSLVRSVQEALRSIPEAFSGIFGTLADPLGAGYIGEDELLVAKEIDADAGTFTALKSSFANDWRRAYAYLLFVLIYFPCVAAMGAIVREIGVKFGILAVSYLTILAWSTSTLFYQITGGHSAVLIVLALGLVGSFIPIFNLVSGRTNFAGVKE